MVVDERVSIVRNTVYYLTANVLGYLFEFVFFMYAARLLGAHRFGALAVATALASILTVVADFGMRMFLVKELAKSATSQAKYVNSVVGMKAVLILGCFGVMTAFTWVVNYVDAGVIYVVGLTVGLKTYASIYFAAFQVQGEMHHEAVARVISGLVPLVGVALLNQSTLSELLVAGIYVAGGVVGLLYCLVVYSQKGESLGVACDWKLWKTIAAGAFPFGVAGILVVLSYWTNTLLLAGLSDQHTVGLYNAAYRLVLAFLCLPTALNSAMYPLLVRRHTTSPETVTAMCENAVKYMLISGLPLGVGVTVLAREIILVAYGPEYTEAALILRILVWSSVLIFLSQPIGYLAASIEKQKTATKVSAGCLALNLALNAVLIPKFGMVGAAVVTVATEAASLAAFWIVAMRNDHALFARETQWLVAKLVLSAAAMALVLTALRPGPQLWVALVAGATVYIGGLWVLRAIDENDLQVFSKVWQLRFLRTPD